MHRDMQGVIVDHVRLIGLQKDYGVCGDVAPRMEQQLESHVGNEIDTATVLLGV